MKKLSLVLVMVLFAVVSMMAQRTISGTITDESGEALIGASILAKGSDAGTVTDIDGSYSLSVPDGTSTLVVSYTGFATQEIALGASNVIDIALSEGVELTEVVVTGLGIKKEKKALGYGVTTLGSADVELKPEADVARVLRGKVPGVNITSTSGLAGSGTNIIIRGFTSISGDNQPLFVVDGVPFNSDTNSDRGFESGGATASSRFLDLDPNNVAEISILKGLSATVLYGEAGRNGVVLVTTKNGDVGSSNKGFEVTLNQSVFATQIGGLAEDQDQYGNGWQNFAAAAFSNWGAPFDQPGRNGLGDDGTIGHPYDRSALNSALPQYVGARYNYTDYDNLQNFFRTGLSNNTSINVAAQAGKTSINANYGYLFDEGFTLKKDNGENSNEFIKHNFGLGTNTQLENGLRIASTFNFINSNRVTPPAAPIYSSNPIDGTSLFSNVLYTPRSVDLHGLEYANPVDNTSIYYRGGNDIQHPLWTLNNVDDREKVRRFFSTITTSYDLTDWLTAQYRLGFDTYTQNQRYRVNKGGRNIPDGALSTSNRLNLLLDHNFSFLYNVNLSEDWNLDGVVGLNMRRETQDRTFTNSTQQFVYGLLNHGNFIEHNNFGFTEEENTIGAYATISAGFKNFLYLNLQGRNDWTSTLEEENRSIFYPSASVAFIPTEAFSGLNNNDVLNYLKLRLGYGTSAGYPDPYRTRNILGTSPNAFNTAGGTVVNTNAVSNRFGNPNLAPETHSELEFGVEAKFVKNRIGLDLSAYNKNSRDLIIDLDLDPSSGYTVSTINSASLNNKGIELGLNIVPVRNKNLRWDIGVNFTRNVSEIESVADGVDQVLIDGFSFLGNFAVPGQPYGVIQGTMIVRDDAGNPVISPAGTYQQAPENGIIGDPNPDFMLNGNTSVSWKFLSARVQLDYQHGGDIWGSTASTLTGRGIAEETGFDRFVPVIANGVDADGNPNTVQITPNRHYWEHTGVFYDENRIFDATTLRLREISLSFDVPSDWLDGSPFGSASLTLAGQNLWYRAFNFPESINFDPEVLSLGVGNGQGFDYVTGPTSRRYGASLRVSF